MLVLLCVQVVQTNNNELNSKNNFLLQINKRYASLPKKQKILIKKSSWQDTQGSQSQCKLSY
jgi:hypothetical protein